MNDERRVDPEPARFKGKSFLPCTPPLKTVPDVVTADPAADPDVQTVYVWPQVALSALW